MSEPIVPYRRGQLALFILVVALLLGACRLAPGASAAASQPAPSPGASMPASAEPTPEETPAPSGVDATVAAGLAVVKTLDGLEQVFVIDPDGSERQVSGLGRHEGIGGVQPLWSPDRTMIAFVPPSIGAGLDAQLWIVGADGSDQRALAAAGEFTDWSPDSTRLVWTDSVFTSDNRGEPPRLWVGDVASGEARTLGLLGNDTRWLPDGERISYVPYEPLGRVRTVVVRADGSRSRELVEGSGIRWAPDGGAFAFEREDGIYLADADGGNVRLLIGGAAAPAWSADGSRLAFVDNDEMGNFVVGVATREGDVVWEGSPGADPAWSPNGAHIAVDLTIGEPLIGILDATTGERVWLMEGRFPDW
jgi:Tol biopolymer transport system component